ncbi:MAG: phage major capsid protein [Kiloniellales bacterium]
MPEIADIRTKVDELGHAWHSFTEENDKGRRADREKLAKINGELDRLSDHIGRLETALKRTHPSHRSGEAGWHRSASGRAFAGFLRKGTERLAPDEVKALTVSNDTTGGFLAPPEYVREIIKGETEISPIRAVARVRQTGNRAVQVPKRTGQFAAQWTGEVETRAETTGLTYGLEELPTHELYALVDISQQDLEDAEFNLEEELGQEFAEQFSLAEGTAFVSGNGVKQPAGFMADSTVASDNSGSAATVADANGQANGLIDLFHNLKTAYARNGTWLLSRKTLGAVRKLKDANNNYVWQPGLAMGMPATILGAPYVEAPDMPDEAANAFPIAFGDFRRAYLIVDRIQMSVLRDPFTQATSGSVRFIARRRVGGQVVLAEAIRKLKCST